MYIILYTDISSIPKKQMLPHQAWLSIAQRSEVQARPTCNIPTNPTHVAGGKGVRGTQREKSVAKVVETMGKSEKPSMEIHRTNMEKHKTL